MKETRLYGLFEKINGKWQRIGNLAFRKSVAIRVFQSALLGGTMNGKEMGLRVVKGTPAPNGWEAV